MFINWLNNNNNNNNNNLIDILLILHDTFLLIIFNVGSILFRIDDIILPTRY